MQTEKQKWIEEVLKSTEGVSRAEAPDMTDTILSRIGTSAQYSIASSNDKTFVWRIAASVVFLLLINAVTIYSYQNNVIRTQHQIQIQAAASEFGMGQNNSNDPGTTFFGN